MFVTMALLYHLSPLLLVNPIQKGTLATNFPDFLTDSQRVPDALAELGELAKSPEANIIKLPNISASVPQLTAAIKELQKLGYELPDYPEDAHTDEQKEILNRYNKIKNCCSL